MWELLSCLSLKGEGGCQANGGESFCGLIPSLTLPFSRGGEIFRTSLFEHHLFSNRLPLCANAVEAMKKEKR
jgi:hypothetical protein